eukprot:990559-Amphidinium_carterae.1
MAARTSRAQNFEISSRILTLVRFSTSDYVYPYRSKRIWLIPYVVDCCAVRHTVRRAGATILIILWHCNQGAGVHGKMLVKVPSARDSLPIGTPDRTNPRGSER